MRRFNTAGPCDATRHYTLPAAARLPRARDLVEQGEYFVLHAPRQTGKSTTLRALAEALTAEGRFAALYFTCEAAEPAQDRFGDAERVILSAIRHAARIDLPAELQPPPWPPNPDGAQIVDALTAWAESCPRPVVLFFDEIDALRGDSLRSVLRQLRAGFTRRPAHFPHAVALCGLRDVRDYRGAAGSDLDRLGTASPFNVKVESLRLTDFSEADVRDLFAMHTVETGQVFDESAIRAAFHYTRGQPWLVNALAREVVTQVCPPPMVIREAQIDRAKENLILQRATHLDSLVARLHEPRVKGVIEPVLAGQMPRDDILDDDYAYVCDLGLIRPGLPAEVANPIYREVIVRVLATNADAGIVPPPKGRWVLADGRLDLLGLLDGFVEFWSEHGDVLAARMPYHEVAPHLILMAWLQRVVNGGGFIDREYGVGRGRIDLLVRWPRGGGTDRFALELKVWASGRPDPLAKGLVQLDAYLAGLGLDTGVLVLFDRREGVPEAAARTRWEDALTPSRRVVRVLRA